MLRHTAPTHMMYGGSAFLGYDLIIEFWRHHDEGNPRPMILDHLFATSVIGTVGGFLATNTIRGAFQGFLWFGLNVGFLSYWAMKMGMRPASAPGSVLMYYEQDVTKEERERFEMQDQIQILAHNMCTKPGYGLEQLQQKFE